MQRATLLAALVLLPACYDSSAHGYDALFGDLADDGIGLDAGMDAGDPCHALAVTVCTVATVTTCYGSDAASLPTDTASCVTAMTRHCGDGADAGQTCGSPDACVCVGGACVAQADFVAMSPTCAPLY